VASIYARGNVLWCRVKDGARWVRMPTPYRIGDEAKARRFADRAQEALAAKHAVVTIGPLTVAAYADRWLTARRDLHAATLARYLATGSGSVQHRGHKTEEGRMRLHILPHLGSMLLADVRPRHLATWIHALRTTTTLAPHTIHSVYGLAGSMFRDAAIAGHVDATPAILTSAQLGEDVGSVEGAGRYTREQLATMIGSVALPEHARVFVALGGLAGLRLGAIAGLRWGDVDTTAAPLWRLTSSRTYDGQPTKTGAASVVPVHPVLADMLGRWRHGWGAAFDRAPGAADPVVPRMPGRWCLHAGKAHTKHTADLLVDRILATVAVPPAPMKAHALRSTFISIALEDGADPRLIERMTHTPGKTRSAFTRYDRADYWPQLCAEVQRIQIAPRLGGKVLALSTGRSTWDATARNQKAK